MLFAPVVIGQSSYFSIGFCNNNNNSENNFIKSKVLSSQLAH